MEISSQLYLLEMQRAAKYILHRAQGRSLDEYLLEEDLRFAIERNFILIGEAMVLLRRNYPEMSRTCKPFIIYDMLRCPCCGYRTLNERAGFEICSVCYWEDDGQDNSDADVVCGGPNNLLSLSEARENFREIGASDLLFIGEVRPPLPEEI